ncbi:MAG: YesL family protein [Lachnospiraceae bacterium]|nr:YesL family protein [Lachnospiraceae bacterium]
MAQGEKKKNSLFSQDSGLTQFLQFAGELIILSLLWVLTSIPVITIGTSTAALYYAVVKSVRCSRGSFVKEYFHAWKQNLFKGCILTVFWLLCIIFLYNCMQNLGTSMWELLSPEHVQAGSGESMLGLYLICGLAMIILGILFIYIFPVLSRFDIGTVQILFMAFVMAIRYIHYTIALVAVLLALGVLAVRIPAAMMFVPGVWAMTSSHLIEKAMKKYLPEPAEGEDAWWLEL